MGLQIENVPTGHKWLPQSPVQVKQVVSPLKVLPFQSHFWKGTPLNVEVIPEKFLILNLQHYIILILFFVAVLQRLKTLKYSDKV